MLFSSLAVALAASSLVAAAETSITMEAVLIDTTMNTKDAAVYDVKDATPAQIQAMAAVLTENMGIQGRLAQCAADPTRNATITCNLLSDELIGWNGFYSSAKAVCPTASLNNCALTFAKTADGNEMKYHGAVFEQTSKGHFVPTSSITGDGSFSHSELVFIAELVKGKYGTECVTRGRRRGLFCKDNQFIAFHANCYTQDKVWSCVLLD